MLVLQERETDGGVMMSARADDLAKVGYSIARRVFQRDDIMALRSLLRGHFAVAGRYRYGGKYELRGLHRNPEVGEILLRDSFLQLLADCTSPGLPLLTTECDLHLDILSSWHKDVPITEATREGILGERGWRVYKAAIYLQDQPQDSAGTLKVRPGSHRQSIGQAREEVSLGMNAGDVLIFDVRIDHAGQFPSMAEKALRRVTRPLAGWLDKDPERLFAEARLRLKPQRLMRRERMAVYLTFGPRLPGTYAYELSGRTNHGPLPGEMPPQITERLAAAGIELIANHTH